MIEVILDTLGQAYTRVIVVDDDSQDRTQEIVEELRRDTGVVRLLIRKGVRGLGGAVKFAAQHIDSGYVVVMDADGSHRPKYLPFIFNELDKGYDIVVGSRYVSGGDIVGWPGLRIAISRGATLIAKLFFQLRVSDPMSGFVGCAKPEYLQKGFKASDFKFLLELLVRNRQLHVSEVPIVFYDRARGKSKLGSKTIIKYLKLVLNLLFSKNKSSLPNENWVFDNERE